VEKHPSEREALIEAWLRETVTDKRALRADLKARKDGKLDLETLAERVLRVCASAERTAEAELAFARAALAHGHAPPAELGNLFDLARSSGQWSRRTEALSLIADLAKHGIGRELHEEIAVMARALTTRTEHRWVQPAALATLAAVDPEGAVSIARERLASPSTGDDFLVRERIVELAARGALGATGWSSVVNLALADPSEHVRITIARAERDPLRLQHLATADASAKVRAAAAIGLSQHDAYAAEGVLVAALRDEKHDLVVRTAAEELAALARRDGLRDDGEVTAALATAEGRTDLSPVVRAKIADCLAEVAVFSDPISRAAHEILAPIVAETPVGSQAIIHDQLLRTIDDERLGQVLAVLAQNDFALGVDRLGEAKGNGIVLHRGEARSPALWRVLHELKNPGPSKRQGFDHTIGRKPKGALRAPPGGLAELTATRVPGERVLVDRAGGWGRHLPLVDDLLAADVQGKPMSIVASGGTTTVHPPSGLFARAKGYLTMSLRYAELSELRRRALDSDEAATQVAFVNEVAKRTGISIKYQPHDFALTQAPIAPAEERPSPRGLGVRAMAPRTSDVSQRSAALGILPLAGMFDWTQAKELGHDLVQYASSPQGNRLPHLAAYVAVMLGAFMVRSVAIKKSIEHDREAIPLVIGGWGTRGKSGTERLKAALFQGLGHEVLVKTTGCEAMFIHGIPGQVAREVFIYRPYDKATVWEQRDQLALARAFGVRVFLWECMALQPDLVNLLQAQWMRDDYSTITNAYPDHEDVQGPSGWDVANVISEFVPTNGNLLTAEDQMLPILRERAKERGTALRVVGSRDADLIADDVLARFPYAEHPRNIALVTQLARALGLPSAVALAEMADHVVPDLGVLKDYAAVPHRNRTLSFVNGMSANERTAALGNWVRTGFADHDPDKDPKTWNVTVVNNRGDRVARSEVFARFLVEDIAAHRHVLIGTNVAGLRGFIHEALDKHLLAISPTTELAGDGTERLHLARARLDRAFARLKIGKTDVESVTRELEVLAAPHLDPALIGRLLEPAEPGERYEAALEAVDRELPKLDEELRPFLVRAIARRRAVRAVHAVLNRDLGAEPASVDRAFARAYRSIFEENLVLVEDPQTTGDQILDLVAKSVPPGAHARIMGCQNIKGTGLDFVYRWVSIDTVTRHLANLRSPVRETREEALRALTLHGDYGLLDAKLALAKVEEARETDPHATVLPYDTTVARLKDVVATREKKLVRRTSRTFGESVRAAIGKTFDYLDATRRRKMAHTLLEDLVRMRVSHASAAKRMREIVARAKGGWMMTPA
jgi:poly-gamma-glutamate synthase PgsB/CapB